MSAPYLLHSILENFCSELWAGEQTDAKITRKMETDKLDTSSADPAFAESETTLNSAEVELEENEVNT